jgi:subtilisin family serine protease
MSADRDGATGSGARALLAAGFILLAMPSAARPAVRATGWLQGDSVVVALRSRRLAFSRQTTDSFILALRATPAAGLPGFALLRRSPGTAERGDLARRGLTVLAPVQHRVYLARVSKDLNPADPVVGRILVSLAAFEPADKVAPDLWQERYDSFTVRRGGRAINYALNPDRTLTLTVAFFPGAAADDIAAALAAHSRSRAEVADRTWRVIGSRADLLALAALDIVLAIDPGPPPFVPENDNTRATIGADAVQQWDPATGHAAGLGGAGIQVGVFDKGFDEEHDDFRSIAGGALGPSRVIVSDPARRWHATMVAGVIAGNGWRSDKKDDWDTVNGGSAYQWRGMAPEAELIDALVYTADDKLNFQTQPILGYIRDHGMDLSNHSYSFEKPGSYGIISGIHDRLIRGDEWLDTAPIPPRLEVFSAGNEGATGGYFSLTKEMKNALIVGNWYTAKNRIERNSSLGPTYDGRIKPDVVAPGTFVRSTGFWDPAETDSPCQPLPGGSGTGPRRNFYGVDCGTSLAAPAVTGLLALVLQQYRITFGVDLDHDPPLPSTLRALVIHSARDIAGPTEFTTPDPNIQAFPGPDFVTGWGLVDAGRAVDLVERRLILEDEIGATCDTKSYGFDVVAPFGASEPDSVRVTLAWDDFASLPVTDRSQPRLINDLDLVLIDPNGVRHYPWSLDQEIVDQSQNPLTNEQQVCGMDVLVKRRMSPFNKPVPVSDVAPAGFGRDHLNTVEQVVAGGVAGKWTAEVSGFNLDAGFQRFSLVGISTGIWMIASDLRFFCQAVPAACEGWRPGLCRLHPALCEHPRYVPIRPPGPSITFLDRRDHVLLPLRELVARLGDGNADLRPGATYDITFGPSPSALGLEVYSTRGARLAGGGAPRRALHFTLRPREGEDYLLVLSPSRRTPIGTAFALPAMVRVR